LTTRAMRVKLRAGRAALMAAAYVGIVACGGCRSDEKVASDTATRFMFAMQHKNADEMKATLTQVGQQKWTGDLTKDNDQKNSDSKDNDFVVKQVTIKDQTAEAVVDAVSGKSDHAELRVEMRRENGDWKVYAFEIPANGMNLTYDFEHPENFASNVLYGVGKALGEGFSQLSKGFQSMAEGFSQGMKSGSSNNSNPPK
jgi:hypothetical protein